MLINHPNLKARLETPELPERLTNKEAIARKELAKLIVEAAFQKCDRLGVSVKLHGTHGGFLINPARLNYYHCDAP